MNDPKRVLIIPCSGIGKAYGSVGREAMYALLEDLRLEATETICLSLLTLGDDAAQARVREHPTITIDGCPKACAQVNVEAAGGTPAGIYRVYDVYRAHRELKVRSVSELSASGRKMARILAEEIAVQVDQLRETPDSHSAASLVVDELDETQCGAVTKAGEQ
jgi:sulfite reductase beta subunit-like hemoprotein